MENKIITRAHIDAITDEVIDNFNIVEYVYNYYNKYDHIFMDVETAEEIAELVYRNIKYSL